MKKHLPSLVIIVTAIALAWWQRATVSSIRQESESLRQSLVGEQTGRAVEDGFDPRSPGLEDGSDSPRRVEDFMTFIDQLVAMQRQGKRPQEESLERALVLLTGLTKGERDEILKRIAEQSWPPNVVAGVQMLMIQCLGQTEPRAAVELAIDFRNSVLERGGGSRQASIPLTLALKPWFKSDLKSALAWVEEAKTQNVLPADDPEINALLAGELVAVGRDAALESIARAPSSHWPKMFARAVEKLSSREDRVSFAVSLAERARSEESLRTLTRDAAAPLLNAAFESSAPNLEEVEALVGALQPDPSMGLIELAISQRINGATTDRVNWMLDHYATDEERRRALSMVIPSWAVWDHRAAAAWLNGLEPSGLRDAGVQGFVSTVSRRDPQSAVDWALTIDDEKLQETALQSVYDSWVSEAPEEAEAYFESKVR